LYTNPRAQVKGKPSTEIGQGVKESNSITNNSANHNKPHLPSTGKGACRRKTILKIRAILTINGSETMDGF
jgi:hypothetical protein